MLPRLIVFHHSLASLDDSGQRTWGQFAFHVCEQPEGKACWRLGPCVFTGRCFSGSAQWPHCPGTERRVTVVTPIHLILELLTYEFSLCFELLGVSCISERLRVGDLGKDNG